MVIREVNHVTIHKSIGVLRGLCLLLIFITANSCLDIQKPEEKKQEEAVRQVAKAYFKTFAERSNWDAFCSFYRQDVRFKDITLQLELDSLWQLKRFYQWDEEGQRFKKLYAGQPHLNVTSLVVEGKTVACKGRISPYYYDGILVDTDWGMEFTIWLQFDDNLKIKEQIDWMEYDPVTLKNTIQRYQNNSFKTVPDWLDLSKKN